MVCPSGEKLTMPSSKAELSSPPAGSGRCQLPFSSLVEKNMSERFMPVISDLSLPEAFSLLDAKYRVLNDLSRYIGAKSARRELNILAGATLYRVLGAFFARIANWQPRIPSLARASPGAYSRYCMYASIAG